MSWDYPPLDMNPVFLSGCIIIIIIIIIFEDCFITAIVIDSWLLFFVYVRALFELKINKCFDAANY